MRRRVGCLNGSRRIKIGTDEINLTIPLLSESRETPKVKAHAGAGDWLQVGDSRHQVEPPARAIRKGFGFGRQVFGGTAIEEGGQVCLWAGTACKTPHCPSDMRERRDVVMH